MSTYIIDDNKLYREDDKGLYRDYVLCQADEGDATPRWTGPKIPYGMFREMTAWCEETQRRLKSEAMVLLFLDENNQWKHWYCPQETSGLAVESSDDEALYREERKNFPDRQLGTLHHHCNVSAFQSGTDSSDEDDRDGLHFTIGDLDSKKYSLHARFCINGESHEAPIETLVEMPEWMKNVPEHARMDIMRGLLEAPTEGFKKDHFKDLIEKVVTKKTYSSGIGGYSGYNGYNGYNYGKGKGVVTDDQAVTRLFLAQSDWFPSGDKLARLWFKFTKNIAVDIGDMIYALQQEADSKNAFSVECQAFTKALRQVIKSASWLRAEELIEYLEEVKSIQEDELQETLQEEKEAQFTEERQLQIEEHRATYGLDV
jgi:hypothetical protein